MLADCWSDVRKQRKDPARTWIGRCCRGPRCSFLECWDLCQALDFGSAAPFFPHGGAADGGTAAAQQVGAEMEASLLLLLS